MQMQPNQTNDAPLIFPQAPVGDEQRVADIFSAIQEHVGFIPDGLRLYSLSPPLLETFVGNISYFNGGGTSLSPELTAMIRYLVSWQSGCSFCVDMNESLLVNLGKDLDTLRAARNKAGRSEICSTPWCRQRVCGPSILSCAPSKWNIRARLHDHPRHQPLIERVGNPACHLRLPTLIVVSDTTK